MKWEQQNDLMKIFKNTEVTTDNHNYGSEVGVSLHSMWSGSGSTARNGTEKQKIELLMEEGK